MKKLIILASIVFILISCDSGNMSNSGNTGNETGESNPFLGTWENEDSFRTVFTTTNVTVYRPTGDVYWTATYTYDDTHIIVSLNTALSSQEIIESWGDSEMIPYSFEGEILLFYYVRLSKVID